MMEDKKCVRGKGRKKGEEEKEGEGERKGGKKNPAGV